VIRELEMITAYRLAGVAGVVVELYLGTFSVADDLVFVVGVGQEINFHPQLIED
jgi:hypothetical protein